MGVSKSRDVPWLSIYANICPGQCNIVIDQDFNIVQRMSCIYLK